MSGAAPIVGAGDATGAAVARAFASKALTACVSRRATNADKLEALAQSIRDHDLLARAFAGDARDEDDVVAMFESIERDVAPLEVVVFNISANVNFPITQTTARLYCKVWEMACFGGFLVGREAARRMIPRQRGTVLFTGATASLRGGSGYAAFAGAKASWRRAWLAKVGLRISTLRIQISMDQSIPTSSPVGFPISTLPVQATPPSALTTSYVIM